MSLLFYSSLKNGDGKNLWHLHRNMPKYLNSTFCRSFASLSAALIKSIGEPKIAVLMVANQEELMDMISMDDSFFGYRIILVLPDRRRETIRKGHKLFPRFLTFMDSDMELVGEVLKKMLGRHENTITQN
jgi:hypothetical protein